MRIELDQVAFRAQASEIQLMLELDDYEQIYGALPKAKARLGLGVVAAVLVLAGALLAGCAAGGPHAADDRGLMLLCPDEPGIADPQLIPIAASDCTPLNVFRVHATPI